MKTLALISNQAFSLLNFRGPLIQALVAKGVRVYALAPDYDDQVRQKIMALGAEPVDYTLTRAGMNPWQDCLDTLRLAFVLRRLQPDVTLGYFIKPVIFGTLAAWLARVPHRVAMIEGLGFVFTNNGEALSLKRRLLRTAVSWLYRLALDKAHKVIFLNKDDIAEFVHGNLVDPTKASVVLSNSLNY